MKKTVVVGLNVGHDGGAAVVVDGIVRCAISEERLNRKKHSPGYLNSMFYCLNALSIGVDEVSLLVFSSYGDELPPRYCGALKVLGLPPEKFVTVDHHLSHAYGAYFLSAFDDALVIVIDGEGNNNETESYFIAEGQVVGKIGGNAPTRNVAKGVGRTYEAFTNFLGWTDQEAAKTMSLAAYGDASHVQVPLFELKGTEIRGALEHTYEKGVIEFAGRNALDFGPVYSKGTTPGSHQAAAYVQTETGRIITELVQTLIRDTGKICVCLAGGVALNCSINAKLAGSVEDIFILPAASDKGQALGNALYGFHSLTGYLPRHPLRHDYFGRVYSEEEILAALKRQPAALIDKTVPSGELRYERPSSIARTVASLLAENQIVAWFQGGSELGPRALGHRSILCNPTNRHVKQILDSRVKMREEFRPYAPSCLLDKASEYFRVKEPLPYMLFAVPVPHERRAEIAAVVHVDGSARLQTVTKEENDLFYEVIREFYELAGTPVILNTSFNSQGPMVETPGDAVSIFLSTGIDALAIGNFIAFKN